VARVRALIAGFTGIPVAVVLARAARRLGVRDRLRVNPAQARWKLPPALRSRLARGLDAAAVDAAPEPAGALWLAAIAVAVILGLGFGGPSVAFGFALVVAAAGPATLYALRNRRARRVAAAVPAMLERVAAELRSGGTVATALDAVAHGEGELRADFARIITRARLGAATTQSLAAWARERRVAGVDAAAGALAMCTTVGGRAADALDGLATSLRDRLGVEAEARALSAQARLSALVVGGAPVAYLAWSGVVDPHAIHALTATAMGRACLLAGLVLEALGALWMRRIVARSYA
jgi:tight adherence protein B